MLISSVNRCLCGLLFSLCCTLAWAAPGWVTIADGPAHMVDGKGSAELVEAIKLPNVALVETAADARLLRIEWPDGSALDLGPGTRAMVLAEGLFDGTLRAPGVYLLRGWAKLSAASASTAPALLAHGVTLPPFKGVAVMQVQDSGHRLFAEAGPLLLQPQLQPRGDSAALTLKTGQYHGAAVGDSAAVQTRPPADLLPQLPRAFRDTLPHRLATVQPREVPPRITPLPAYAQLRPWLAAADPALRRTMASRFASWAQQPALKSALAQHINDHREWAPLVLPKPASPKPLAPKTTPAASAASISGTLS
jgi:hypothetical protein